MGSFRDLTGQTFNKLTAIRVARRTGGNVVWLWQCECGKTVEAPGNRVTGGNTKSCGCRKYVAIRLLNKTHGKSKSPEYQTWCNMIARCEKPNRPDYKHYGGRGIRVCARWRGSFEAFLDDMGPKPFPKASIDRKDHNGDYCPENCIWTTQKRQTRNCRDNRYLTFNGKTQCLADWADEIGVLAGTLHSRLYRHGWTVEQALTLPKQHRWSRRSKRNEST